MKLLEGNILYLTFKEIEECGITTEKYLSKAKNAGVKCWTFVPDPKDNRRVLVGYEDLKPEYKDKVNARYGNPYDMVARGPILNQVINSAEANNYYLGYRFDGTKTLPIETVNKYTRADAWLRFINEMGLRKIKDMFPGMNVPDFYSHVTALINLEKLNGKDKDFSGIRQLPGDFPSTYQRLKTKAENYRSGTFDDLISPHFGNKNSTKLGRNEGGFDPELHDKQMAVIRTIAGKHNNLDAEGVRTLADVIFTKNGWKCVSVERIRQILTENKVFLTPGRRGRRAYNSEVAMQIKRIAPQFPTYYATLDGWTAELLYQENGTYNNRLVIVVVLDPFNKYPIGYAIGERENPELIKLAVRNAIEHLAELVGKPQDGGFYIYHQLQSDHYALKTMTPFYQAASHLFTPAAVGNAKSKVIEPYFKYLNKKYCQKYYNWSGFNITANRENQVNSEFLNLIKKEFPSKDGVMQQLHQIMQWEREAKIDEFVSQWHAMLPENRTIMTEEQRIMLFGTLIGEPNSITGEGLVKKIANVKYVYDSFDPLFRQNMHLRWNIIIDEQDRSKALAVSQDSRLRFVLEETMGIPMDIKSTEDIHNEHRARVKAFNKANMDAIVEGRIQDAEIVEEVIRSTPLAIDAHNEAALKLMFTDHKGQQKEGIQNAKGLKAAKKQVQIQEAKQEQASQKSWQEIQQAYLKNSMDYNQLLD